MPVSRNVRRAATCEGEAAFTTRASLPRPSRIGTVASRTGTWQRPEMPPPDPKPAPRSTSAGGVLLALSAVAGAAVGVMSGQPSLGFLLGLGVGGALAFAVWLAERGR